MDGKGFFLKQYTCLLSFALLSLVVSGASHATGVAGVSDYTEVVEDPPHGWDAWHILPHEMPKTDDHVQQVTLPFDFPFGKHGKVRTMYLSSNGYMSPYNWGDYRNTSLASAGVDAMIAIYWDDLDPEKSHYGSLRYGQLGSGDDLRFVVTWENIFHYDNRSSSLGAICHSQLVLYANGNIRFRYNAIQQNCGGESATIGIKENATTFIEHSYNQTINMHKDILYRLKTVPVKKPKLSVDKKVEIISDPIRGLNAPRSVPGAVVQYSLVVKNKGKGKADDNSIAIVDLVPPGSYLLLNDLQGNSGPVTFNDLSRSSGLNYSFDSLRSSSDDLEFSSNNGQSFGYRPSINGAGFDPRITHFRVAPKGEFNAGNKNSAAGFKLTFRTVIN